MAVRVENTSIVNFGTFGAAATVTHFRVSIGNVAIFTRPLTTSRVIAIGGQAQFAADELDFLFPSNQLDDAGYEDLLDLAFDGSNSFNVDLLTSVSQVVSVSGYSQQQVTAWTTSTEADSVELDAEQD